LVLGFRATVVDGDAQMLEAAAGEAGRDALVGNPNTADGLRNGPTPPGEDGRSPEGRSG